MGVVVTDMGIGETRRSNNYGEFFVKKYHDCKNVEIEFVQTGTVETTTISKVRKGAVKDYMYPSNHGVGFFGYGRYNSRKDICAHKCWSEMLKRCYSDNYHKKKPTYMGCEVCEEWQDFQVFASWYYDNHPQDGGVYHLDKDIIKSGNKLYSPEFCNFVTPKENALKAAESRMTTREITSPNGVVHTFTNQAEFCRKNNIDQRAISAVMNKKRLSHKGWSLPK